MVLLVACARVSVQGDPAAAAALAAQQLTDQNRKIAVDFFNMVFQDRKPQEAFDLYSVPDYIQHNELAADGAAPAIEFLNGWFATNPQASAEIKRVIAEGNLVAIHHHMRESPEVPGAAAVDMYRVENGRVVEHWDVFQRMPAESKNDHPKF
jgi:predicted SnoaL-like aldol condensation-catalyzing enzyme